MADIPPHLLMIAWSFPPARTPGVYRVLATVNAFAEAGWDVTVLRADTRAFSALRGLDPSLLDHVDPRVEVISVPFTWAARDPDFKTFSLLRALAPPLWYLKRSDRRVNRVFPELKYGQWKPALLAQALDVHRTKPVSLTIASANPNVAFAAAHELWRQRGVPYVMDYRDTWRLDMYRDQAIWPATSDVGKLERRFLESAAHVWFVNDAIREWHADEYPDLASKMRVVANGWDPAFATVAQRVPRPSPAALRFGYLGTLTPEVPLESILEGWQRAKESGGLPAEATLELAGFLGFAEAPDADRLALVDRHATWGVSYTGKVEKADVKDFYARQDALVLALGASRYVTAGKCYEYIATGLPILSMHSPENDSSRVLRGYPMHVGIADETPQAMGEAFAAMAASIPRYSAADEEAARAFAAPLRRDLQFAAVVDDLSKEFVS